MAVKLGNGNWAVKEDKLLAYNDNSGKFFNKEFDFSRGSSATFVDKDGLIKTAGLQATNLVNNGDFSELGLDLVINGNFSTNSDWNLGSGQWTILNGFAVADNASNNLHTSNAVATATGLQYKVTFTLQDVAQGYVNVGLSNLNSTQFNSDGTHTLYIESSGNRFLYFRPVGFTGKLTNVSVKQVDPNDYWTLLEDVSIRNGVATFLDSGSNPNTRLIQSNILTSGKSYKLSFEVTRYVAGRIQVLFGGSPNIDLDISSGVGTYTVNGVSNGTDIIIKRNGGFSNFDFDITNISVQEIQTDTPRIDFTDSVKGALLLEPQSTNLVRYSEDFTQFTASVASVESGYLAPDGSNNAYKVSGTVGTSALYISVPNISSSATRTIYAKTVSGTGQAHLCSFHTNTNNLFTITSDWQRFEVNGTDRAAGQSNFYAVDFRGSTNLTEIILWGGQAEELPYATSYIPTVGSAVTRLADVCNNSGSAQDFNDSEGVLYAEIAALANDGTVRYLALSDGTQNNRVTILYYGLENRIRAIVSSGGTNSMDKNFIVTSVLDFHKIAVVFKENDFSLWIDGFERRTDTSGLTPTGLDTLEFRLGGANNFFGKVREVQVFTEAKSDAFLQALTTI